MFMCEARLFGVFQSAQQCQCIPGSSGRGASYRQPHYTLTHLHGGNSSSPAAPVCHKRGSWACAGCSGANRCELSAAFLADSVKPFGRRHHILFFNKTRERRRNLQHWLHWRGGLRLIIHNEPGWLQGVKVRPV